MKRKKSLQRVLSAFLTILLLVSVVPTAVFAAGTETYHKISNAAEFETGKYVMAVDTGYAVGPIDGTWVSAVKVTPEGNVITDPDAGMVVDLEVADSSVKIKLSDGNYIAPKGGNNNGIQAGEYDWAWSVENGKFVFSGTEDDTVVLASNKSSQNKFRGYKKATATGNPNGYPYQFTLYKLAESGSGEQTVAAPLADPMAGAVASGAEITLSTATPNAQIYYTLDGSDPADANNTARELYSSENKPVITEDGTLKAVAVLGASMSAVQQLSYTIKGEAVLEDGDQVVIYAPAYNKALSSEKNPDKDFYNAGTDVTVGADGTLTGYTDVDIWTVKDNGDGTFSFGQDGQYLGMQDSYTSMDLGGKHDKWELEDAGEGLYYVKNTGRDAYMEWYDQNNYWSAYYNINTGSEGMFALAFYKVTDTPDQPSGDAGSRAETLQGGDEIVIYLPSAQKAISSEASGSRLVGADAQADGEKITTSADNVTFTVEITEEGEYRFIADGKYLTSGATGNSLTLESEAGQYSQWTLEDADNGSFIKNTAAQYNGNPQYIEYYNSNFTTYGKNSYADEAIYTFQFYYAPEGAVTPEPGAPIKDGDQVVIYAPEYNKALSSEKTGFYNVGTDITIGPDGAVTGYTAANIWTVVANDDGTYSFQQGGKNIGLEDSYASMNLGAVHDDWEVIDLEDGTYNIKNTGRGNYMEWYAQFSNWSTYNSSSAATDGQFKLKFYKVESMPVDPEEPAVEGLEVEASPKSGASVEAGQTIVLTAADGAEIYYTMSTDGTEPADPDVTSVSQKYTAPIEIEKTPETDKPVIIKAVAHIPAAGVEEAQTGEVVTFTYKAPMNLGDYTLYFGQLHAHTNLSDGTGTVEQAFDHASKVDNLDFLALTDHSNSFDNDANVHLDSENAEELSEEWEEGRSGARNITERENGTFVGLYGFEMTWSGGAPGHINTFNSDGFESRNCAPYKKGDNYDVLQAYFDTLNENPETISQFNHPGDTFGDFMDFSLYDPVVDNQITLIEVGNGEGAIGSSGYFPSYSYYTRALDKGWHVAPTNNQDNHKGNWGDSNTARSVVLATDLSEEAIYDAMKNYRVYATEDNDLSILYSLNGNAMGSILDDQEAVNIEVSISDPTDTAGSTKVEVIVNGGQTLAEQTFEGGSADISFDNLPATYGYYYLRITQADKNIAVTAPVWVGESLNAGVSKTSSSVALPIKGDEISISSQIYNNLSDNMQVTSLTYTMEGQAEPFHTADVSSIGSNGVVAPRTSYSYEFPYMADQAGGFNINVQMKAIINGEEFTFTDVLKLSVSDPAIATKVLIDGTHYNDYVNGYYSGNMTNFINMGTADNIQVKIAQPGETITAETLSDVSLFVISAPLKYTSDYTGEAKVSVFENEFVNLVRDYVQEGGTVIVCGLADYQDANSGSPHTTYEQVNKLLEAIGATMRVNDDELIDQYDNGGQPYRLYFDDFNTGSTDPVVQEVLKGVVDSGLRYSSYSGCSVAVGNGEAIVYGHDTTYSINSKNPAQGHNKPVLSYSDLYDSESAVVQKGDVVAMATEPVGEGRVFLSGTVFCSNFEVAAEDQVSYSNGIIAQNILNMVKKEPVISTIEEARAGTDGQVFTVVGTVANGTAETGNAFFNTIYIQDDAGNGINVFPIDDNNIRRGDQVMITGSISEYIGDKQLSAINVTVLEGSKEVIISDATTKEADDYEANFGKLVRVEGVVQSVKLANGIVESIELQDESGQSCRVFIDGYIDYSDDASPELEGFVKEGATISAVGFVSHDAEGNRLRVRDRSEIKAEEQSPVSESYDVIFALANGAADGALKAEGGKDYAATLKPADGYALPETVKVIVGDAELPSEGYSYNAVTGELMIYGAYITGDIQILAEFIKEPSEEPGDTEQPGDTETPDDTEKPGESENPDGETPSEVPETGDAANIAVWLLVFAASGILVILTLFKRKGTAK